MAVVQSGIVDVGEGLLQQGNGVVGVGGGRVGCCSVYPVGRGLIVARTC